MLKNIVFLCAAVVSTSSAANLNNKEYGTLIVEQITSIYDGDTFRANLKGVPPIIGNRMSIRLSGVDTPEIRGKCDREKKLALQAKQFTVAFLRNAKFIQLIHIKRGKYFRIVAEVDADGQNLSDALVKAGLAVPYDGGTKTNWCE